MSDKLMAGLVTALLVAPICAVCILGPAVLGAGIGWILGWLGDLGVVEAASAAVLAGVLSHWLWRRWRRTRDRTAAPESAASSASKRTI